MQSQCASFQNWGSQAGLERTLQQTLSALISVLKKVDSIFIFYLLSPHKKALKPVPTSIGY